MEDESLPFTLGDYMSILINSKKFWNQFLSYEKDIKKALQDQDYETLNPLVEDLDDLAIELTGCHFFVENIYDDYECTFDTGPNKTGQYLAQYFTKMAPKEVQDHWIINSCLPPLSSKAVLAAVQIQDEQYTISDFYVCYGVDENQDLVHAKVYCSGYSSIDNTETKKEMSMYLLELALGECAYEAYLSRVDYIDVPDDSEMFCSLVDFYENLMNLVEKKGWKEYNSPLDIYSVYRPIQDFAHDSLRKDMKLIFTTHPLLVEEDIENKNDVISDLGARNGEYGYIYFMNPYGNEQDATLRQELSKVLDAQFDKVHAAKVIGGAIGKSYSYIDCIIFDKARFEKSFQQIKRQFDKNVELFYQPFKIKDED